MLVSFNKSVFSQFEVVKSAACINRFGQVFESDLAIVPQLESDNDNVQVTRTPLYARIDETRGAINFYEDFMDAEGTHGYTEVSGLWAQYSAKLTFLVITREWGVMAEYLQERLMQSMFSPAEKRTKVRKQPTSFLTEFSPTDWETCYLATAYGLQRSEETHGKFGSILVETPKEVTQSLGAFKFKNITANFYDAKAGVVGAIIQNGRTGDTIVTGQALDGGKLESTIDKVLALL